MKTYKNVDYMGNDYKICKGYNYYSTPSKILSFHENTRVISAGAFSGKEFERIDFSKNLESINEDAFLESKIKKASIKNKVKLKKASFKTSVLGDILINTETIPHDCFNNSDIQNLELIGTTSISNDAFYSANIQTLTLPICLKSIGSRAFYNAKFANKTFIVPDNVTSILDYALCTKSLDTIYLPYNLKTLDPCFANQNTTIIVDKDTYNRFPCLKHYNIKFTDLDNLIEEHKTFKEINNFYNKNKIER